MNDTLNNVIFEIAKFEFKVTVRYGLWRKHPDVTQWRTIMVSKTAWIRKVSLFQKLTVNETNKNNNNINNKVSIKSSYVRILLDVNTFHQKQTNKGLDENIY